MSVPSWFVTRSEIRKSQYIYLYYHHHQKSIMLKGRTFTPSAGKQAGVLPKAGFPPKLRNQGCSCTRDWIGEEASRCYDTHTHTHTHTDTHTHIYIYIYLFIYLHIYTVYMQISSFVIFSHNFLFFHILSLFHIFPRSSDVSSVASGECVGA